tara:strand:+ start:1682 stop:2806 length:1125 start_codon:yes stop_codon:yes gene_type:complete
MKTDAGIACKNESIKSAALPQRTLLISAAVLTAVGSGWAVSETDASSGFFAASLTLSILTLAIAALTFSHNMTVRLNIIPCATALVYGIYINATSLDQAAMYSLSFTLLGFFVVGLAPRLPGAAGALFITTILGATGVVSALMTPDATLSVTTLLLWLPGIALAGVLAGILEQARRRTFALTSELERRATSDDLSGVSNRAHINLLAQNEFARARRYREPYACLMLEIDDFETLSSTYGLHTADIVVQVLSGYCVVVMRHCDSFGRLSPHRFLALLPETEGHGALTLASRMCRDIAALSVKANGQSVGFTISIGGAELHQSDRWVGDMLRRTEQALDDAIEGGRNSAVLATTPPDITDDSTFPNPHETPISTAP